MNPLDALKGIDPAQMEAADADDPVRDELGRQAVLDTPALWPMEREMCRRFHARFCRRWLQVQPKRGEIVRFKFWPTQRRLHELWEHLGATRDRIRIRILKARQQGFSTYVQSRFCAAGSLTNDLSGLTVSCDTDSAQRIFTMTKTFLDFLPPFLKPITKYDRRNEVVFADTRSRLHVVTANRVKAGSGFTFRFIHASEVAKWENPEGTVGSLYMAANMPGSVIVEEFTAYGATGYAHDQWARTQEAQDAGKETEWVNIFFPWFEHPEYCEHLFEGEEEAIRKDLDAEEGHLVETYKVGMGQIKWRRRTIAHTCGGDLDRFHQDYPSHWQEAFLSSGRPYFDRAVLSGWAEKARNEAPPISVPLQASVAVPGRSPVLVEAVARVWKLPQPGRQYVIGADVAEGVTAHKNNQDPDYSVGDLGYLDGAEAGDQVGELRGRFDPDVFGALLHKFGSMYNSALIAPETHSVGTGTVNALQRLQYPNLYIDPHRTISMENPLYGWDTNLRSKPHLMSTSRAWTSKTMARIRSLVSLAEHMAVEQDEHGKVETREGHNDCVMARGIRLVLTEERAYTVEAQQKTEVFPDIEELVRRHLEKQAEEASQPEAYSPGDGEYQLIA